MHNTTIIMERNLRAYVVMMRLSQSLKENPKASTLEAITAEVPKAELYKLFGKNALKELLQYLIDENIIKKVDPSQKDNRYYFNPNIVNTLSSKQAHDYVDNHIWLFKPLE